MKKYVDENILEESLANKAEITTVQNILNILNNYN